MPHSQGLSNNSYAIKLFTKEQTFPLTSNYISINPITRIDIYLFKVHSNIVLPSTPWPPQRSLSWKFTVKISKSLLPSSILAT